MVVESVTWHRWEQPLVAAVYRVTSVVAVVQAFPTG